MDEFLKDINYAVFKQWVIKCYDYGELEHSYDGEDIIEIRTKYSYTIIRFQPMNIIEFSVKNTLTNEIEFYIHFQMKNMNHALSLFNEMIEIVRHLIHRPKVKVLLTCTTALTTTYFAQQLNAACKVLLINYQFDAIGFDTLDKKANDADIILIAPQIAYQQPHVQQRYSNKLVMRIPPKVFAGYNVASMLGILLRTEETKKHEREHPTVLSEVSQEHGEILTLSIIRNSSRVHLSYRLFAKDNSILEDGDIVKQSLSLNDVFDLIDTIMVTHRKIKAVGIATPGIIIDGKVTSLGIPGAAEIIDLKGEFKKRYKQRLVIMNDVNSIAVGYHACQTQYHNISFIFQPISTLAGIGNIINDELYLGRLGLAGESQFLDLNLSDDRLELNKTAEGTVELLSKQVAAIIGMLSPELIVVASQMLPRVTDLREALKQMMPEEYIPPIVRLYYLQDYSFIGCLITCIRKLYV